MKKEGVEKMKKKRKTGMKCVCGKIAEDAKLSFLGHEIDGWKCNCGQEYHHPIQAERILLLNKLKKSGFEVKLTQSRSNLILRIPKKVQEALGLVRGGVLTLKVPADNKIELIAP